MPSTTLKELEWLHDCTLINVLYEASFSHLSRSIKLTMQCPADLGYAPWDGRNLVLTAFGVVVSKYNTCPVAGIETIDTVRPGVSAVVQESTIKARRMGMHFPNLEFTISFSSGSGLEVICEELHVDVE